MISDRKNAGFSEESSCLRLFRRRYGFVLFLKNRKISTGKNFIVTTICQPEQFITDPGKNDTVLIAASISSSVVATVVLLVSIQDFGKYGKKESISFP